MRACSLSCENGSWFDHVLEWYEASKADPEHVLFLRYEDMMADPISNVKKIADFSGIETTPEIIEKVRKQTRPHERVSFLSTENY